MEQTFPQHVDLPPLHWVKVYWKEPSAFIDDEHTRECTMFHFGIYRHSFVNTSWDRSTRHRAHPKRNALGGKVLAGTFLSHMAGRSLPFHSPVGFLFISYPSHGKSADLCSACWAWLRPWLSTPGSVSTWSAAVFTGPVSLTAQPSAPSWRSTDDLEGREACRSWSCSWLFTGARQWLAVDLFPRSGEFRGVADFVHGKMDGMHVWSFEDFPRTRAFVFTLPWLFCILASRVFNFFSSDRHFSSDNFSFGSSWPFYFFFHLRLLSLSVLSSKAIMMKVQRLPPSARRHAQQD